MPNIIVVVAILIVTTLAGAAAHVRPAPIRSTAAALRAAVGTRLRDTLAALPPPRGLVLWFAQWLIGLVTAISTVGYLLRWLGRGESTGLDRLVTDVFLRGRVPWISTVWNVITFLGASVFLASVALVVGLVWRVRRGDWFLLSTLGGAYVGAAILFNAAKRVVGRTRPGVEIAFELERGLAFPSGHAADAAAVYVAAGLVATALVASWTLRVAIGSTSAAIVLLIAASRLYLGVHWFTDVLAGAVLGTVWSAVLWLTLTAPDGPYAHYAPERSPPPAGRDGG